MKIDWDKFTDRLGTVAMTLITLMLIPIVAMMFYVAWALLTKHIPITH